MSDGFDDMPLSKVPACGCGRLKNMLGCDGSWRCAVCDVAECKRRWAKTMKWLQVKDDVLSGKIVPKENYRKREK